VSERLYSTDFASVCINHHKPEEHSSVVALKAELAELRQKAAFVDEMAKINKARREGAVDGYCETEHCQHWDGDACAMLWLCSDVALAWDCWQEAHREAE